MDRLLDEIQAFLDRPGHQIKYVVVSIEALYMYRSELEELARQYNLELLVALPD